MFIGFCLSWLIPETKGKTLEELCGENSEDELRRQYEVNRREREEEEARRAERRSKIEASGTLNSAVAKLEELDG